MGDQATGVYAEAVLNLIKREGITLSQLRLI